jgi:hypothetical protein
MMVLVLGAILVVLVVLFLATFWSLSSRVDRVAETNAILLDLVATHIVLSEEERARLAVATGDTRMRAGGRGPRAG